MTTTLLDNPAVTIIDGPGLGLSHSMRMAQDYDQLKLVLDTVGRDLYLAPSAYARAAAGVINTIPGPDQPLTVVYVRVPDQLCWTLDPGVDSRALLDQALPLAQQLVDQLAAAHPDDGYRYEWTVNAGLAEVQIMGLAAGAKRPTAGFTPQFVTAADLFTQFPDLIDHSQIGEATLLDINKMAFDLAARAPVRLAENATTPVGPCFIVGLRSHLLQARREANQAPDRPVVEQEWLVQHQWHSMVDDTTTVEQLDQITVQAREQGIREGVTVVGAAAYLHHCRATARSVVRDHLRRAGIDYQQARAVAGRYAAERNGLIDRVLGWQDPQDGNPEVAALADVTDQTIRNMRRRLAPDRDHVAGEPTATLP